jgi:hypothetical protein
VPNNSHTVISSSSSASNAHAGYTDDSLEALRRVAEELALDVYKCASSNEDYAPLMAAKVTSVLCHCNKTDTSLWSQRDMLHNLQKHRERHLQQGETTLAEKCDGIIAFVEEVRSLLVMWCCHISWHLLKKERGDGSQRGWEPSGTRAAPLLACGRKGEGILADKRLIRLTTRIAFSGGAQVQRSCCCDNAEEGHCGTPQNSQGWEGALAKGKGFWLVAGRAGQAHRHPRERQSAAAGGFVSLESWFVCSLSTTRQLEQHFDIEEGGLDSVVTTQRRKKVRLQLYLFEWLTWCEIKALSEANADFERVETEIFEL